MRFILLSCCFVVLFGAVLAAQPRRANSTAPTQGAATQGQAVQQTVAPVKPEDRCTVEGSIFNATTGEPLRKANVTLRRANAGGGGFPGGPGGPGGGMSYASTTDAGGRYRIADIEPGRYRLAVEKAGFVDEQYGAKRPGDAGSILTLEKAQRISDAAVKMTPQGVVAGRVLDEDGEPVMGANIQILHRTYIRGKKTFSPVDNASTNDLGEYRVFGLAPGKYVVSASYRRMRGQAVQQDAEVETYAQTFYPSGSSPEMAAPVDIQPGSQFRGLDLRLRKTRAVRIQGRVIGGGGGDRRGGANISLVPKGANDFFNRSASRTYNAQGDFVINNVAPGSYILTANGNDGGKPVSARIPLEVGNSPIEGLTLTLQPGAELRGRLKIEGSATPDIKNFRVMLQARAGGGAMFGPGGGQQFGGLKEDNTFTLANVNADAYDVRVSGVPDGGYIKAIKLGDADVTDTGLDFTAAVIPAELTVVVNMAAGQLDGVVQTDQSQPASGAMVVLVPEGARRENDRYYVTASTDDTGHFTLKNVTPGEYRVYSFDNVKGSSYMDPEWLQPFESKGERVLVKESGKDTVQLKVVLTQGV